MLPSPVRADFLFCFTHPFHSRAKFFPTKGCWYASDSFRAGYYMSAHSKCYTVGGQLVLLGSPPVDVKLEPGVCFREGAGSS
jgi:hypothetical protein